MVHMDKKYQYQQGQRVYYNMGNGIKGWATICGSATDELPEIGRNWIIEPHEPLPFDKKVYPFSHMTAFGCCLKTEEFELNDAAPPTEGGTTP